MNYYARYLRRLKRGIKSSPRGMVTHALYNRSVEFTPLTCWRRMRDNPAIGLIEGLQFIAGVDDRNAIQAVAPNIDLSLFGPTSFYGPRTVGQFEQAIEELKRDKESRRAVVLVAHHDDVPDTIPCTQLLHFYYRPDNPALQCTITMRSSDAVWGLPYDMIQFGMVVYAMASCLGSPAGTVYVNMTNAHIYEDHDGGMHWELGSFSMPAYDDWKSYKSWAVETVFRHHTRRELESMFEMRKGESYDTPVQRSFEWQ